MRSDMMRMWLVLAISTIFISACIKSDDGEEGSIFISSPKKPKVVKGITDTEIHVGHFGPQTGPAAAWGSLTRGMDGYIKMVNAKGGVHGRKIVFHHFDDTYNPAKTKAGVQQLQESSHGIFAWIGGVGTAPCMAVKGYLLERDTPMIAPLTGAKVLSSPPMKYLFALYPWYEIESRALIKFSIQYLNKKKIAFVYQNDEYGKSGVRAAEEEMERFGLSLIAKIPQNPEDKDLNSHIARIAKSKADVVVVWTSPAPAIRMIMIGKTKKLKVQWMTSSTLSDHTYMYELTKGLFKGVITAGFGLLPNSQHSRMRKYKREIFEKHASEDERWGTFYTAGIGFAEPFVEALKIAGRDLNREKLVESLESLKDFQGILGKISYKKYNPNDPTTRQGQKSVYISQCLEGGKTRILTDWIID